MAGGGGGGDATAAAAASWNAAGGPQIVPASGGAAPTVTVEELNDPSVPWVGLYVSGDMLTPAKIYVNKINLAPGQSEQGVIAHELGHALGLPDTATPGRLMTGSQGGQGGPQAADLAALQNLPQQIEACRAAGYVQYDCKLWGWHAPGVSNWMGNDSGGCVGGQWWKDHWKEIALDTAMVAAIAVTGGADAAVVFAARVAAEKALQAAIRAEKEELAAKEEAEAAAKEAAEEAFNKQIGDEVSKAMNDGAADHAFRNEPAKGHDFGKMINDMGSKENILKEVFKQLHSKSLPASGAFPTQSVVVDGQTLSVNGAVVNGMIRISTIWFP